MKNLNKNIVITVILELLTLEVPIILKAKESYFVFWILFVFSINIVGIILLIRHRPKHYAVSIAALLLIILAPILFIFSALGRIQC